MKLPTYKDVLTMGKEALDAALVPIRAAKAKKQAELEMCKIDEEIATTEARLHETCCNKEVDFGKIVELQDSLALTARKREQYKKIIAEMFPEEVS